MPRTPPLPTLFPYTTLFRSADKDLMGVPARLHRPAVHHWNGTLIRKAMTIDVTPLEAIRFHFWQTLVGDVTDGYVDRKSTRLNSSHVEISYAVFCLKKKTDC